MSGDGSWFGVELFEGGGESSVELGGRPEEAVVGRGPLGGLPDAFDGVGLGGVGRQAGFQHPDDYCKDWT